MHVFTTLRAIEKCVAATCVEVIAFNTAKCNHAFIGEHFLSLICLASLELSSWFGRDLNFVREQNNPLQAVMLVSSASLPE